MSFQLYVHTKTHNRGRSLQSYFIKTKAIPSISSLLKLSTCFLDDFGFRQDTLIIYSTRYLLLIRQLAEMSSEAKCTQMTSMPTTDHASLPSGRLQLNPQATVFSPALNLKPKVAAFPLALRIPPSALNPLAPTFSPAHTNTKRSHPDLHAAAAAVSSSLGLLYPSSPLNPLAPTFLTANAPISVSAATTEATEQWKPVSATSEETSNFEVDPCTREELDFSADGECVKASGLLSADHTPDLSSCSTFSTTGDVELISQKLQIQQDPEIHHFNWLGTGMMAKTSTPAAISLAIAMMPAPARYVDEENLRDQTILRQAMSTIDPVVYHGDINELKNLKGERLREAAVGSTTIFYTPFGWWRNDVYGENEERPVTDEFDMTRYTEGNTIVNGWLETATPTRQSLFDNATESYYSALDARKKRVKDRMLCGVGITPLRFVMTTDGLEFNTAAKQHFSADASGLITAAVLCSNGTKTSSSAMPVPNDDLFKNANWADDLDDEDEAMTGTQASPASQPRESMAAMLPSKQTAMHGEEKPAPIQISQTAENHAETRQALKLTPHFRPVIPGTGGFRFEPVFPFQQQLQLHTAPAQEFSIPASIPNSLFVSEAEEEEGYGSGSETTSLSTSPYEESYASSTSSLSLDAEEPATSAAGYMDAMQERRQKDVDEEDNFFSEPAAIVVESMESVTMSKFSLPIRNRPAELVSPRVITLPIHSRVANSSATKTLELLIHPNHIVKPVHDKTTAESEEESATIASALEPDQKQNEQDAQADSVDALPRNGPDEQEEQLIAEEESDGDLRRTPRKQALAAPTPPASPTGSPSDLWQNSSAIVSPLTYKKGRSSQQMRSVASEYKIPITPKFSLVLDSMASMVRFHPQKLEEIEEKDEEEADNESVSNISAKFDETTDDEEEVIAKFKMAISKGHVVLTRSPFIKNLSSFDNTSKPATPERSPVPSPYKRPASNTPNAMLGKKVQFSLPRNDEGSRSAEELVGITGIGAVFEDNEEEAEDGSSILCGAEPSDDYDVICLQSGIASRSFTVLPELTTSTTISDDIFTVPSASISVLSTVEISPEGSLSPGAIAPATPHPILVAEPWPAQEQPAVQTRKSSWASIKDSMRTSSGGCFTPAADLQFAHTQHRTSSWTMVQNKLQKPKPVVARQAEKKQRGFRQAWKKVKSVFVNSVKALS